MKRSDTKLSSQMTLNKYLEDKISSLVMEKEETIIKLKSELLVVQNRMKKQEKDLKKIGTTDERGTQRLQETVEVEKLLTM